MGGVLYRPRDALAHDVTPSASFSCFFLFSLRNVSKPDSAEDDTISIVARLIL